MSYAQNKRKKRLALFFASRLVHPLSLVIVLIAASPSLAALALDGIGKGHTTGGTSVATSTALTTTGPGLIYVVVLVNNGPTAISSMTGASLSWAERTSNINGNDNIFLWSAYSSGAISSQTITANFNGTTNFATIVAFGVSGVPSSSYFDVNASLPAHEADSSVTISTTAADTFIVAGMRCGGTATHAASFTAIFDDGTEGGNNFFLVQYKIVSADQTNLVVDAASCGGNGSVVDAVVQAPPARRVIAPIFFQ